MKCAMIVLSLTLAACRGSDKPPVFEASATSNSAGAASSASSHLFQGQEDALNKAKSTASQMSKEGEETAKAIESATK